ncbi:MAG: hypothetical protein PHG03_05935, partial [Bacilli bacterium]|nr:hypothetical protein [Bacilli bacterium]
YGNFEVPTDGNKTHTYKLELYFPNQDYDQNIEQQKQINAYVAVVNIDNNMLLPYNKTKGVNNPVLFTGMTPVKWDDSFNEIETNQYDSDWYDYNNKKWANAKTADGSYWVWVPRYAYKITNGYHSSTAGTIDVVFLKEDTIENESSTTIETTGYVYNVKDTAMHHFLHPAFETEGSELGFWVAKFEPTADESVATITGTCDEADNVSTKTVKIIPKATSWRCITNSNAFDAVLNMKTNPVYGWEPEEVDPHLLTNLEWGAVAYLSKSGYGADAEEIWNNAFYQYRTGCSGEGVDASSEETCVAYNTTNGQKASTTHNIYGVYDMSGGAYDRVSAYVDNDNENLAANGQSILNALDKYKNIYEAGTEDTRPLNYEANKNVYGDAVYETSSTGEDLTSWHGDYSYMPHASNPWFNRGGTFSYGTIAGPFGFYLSAGAANVSISFRPGVRCAS